MNTYARLLIMILAAIGPTLAHDGWAAAGKISARSAAQDASRLALRYAEALASGHVDEWARLDLGCLSRLRTGRGLSAEARSATARACYEDTVKAHRALVQGDIEFGIFGPNGRGRSLGLLSETHRHADLWKTYPPALFLSPAVMRSDLKARPTVEVRTVSPARPIAIQQGTAASVTVDGTLVELAVTYPDPFTAPLALAPGEAWWASGTARRYQPVQRVVIRMVVAGNLHRLGYTADRAVINEALPDAPHILATSYGMHATDEALQPDVRGHFVLGSARWWTRDLAGDRYTEAVKRVAVTADHQEKRALLASLLLVDPTDPQVNAWLGALEYETFLRTGLGRAGIGAGDEATKRRVAELYWNLQAQTWRQELTDVAIGHSSAAEAFYAAFRALDVAVAAGTAPPELQRQLGVLHRWNNNVQEALALHESLLREATTDDARGRLLADIAWDRIQWVSWERRNDHPWLEQAQTEARQALELVDAPVERVLAAQALLVGEALSFTRTPDGLQGRLRAVKDHHEHLTGVTGLWPYLVGNDLVKALVPDGQHVTLPTPVRAPDVLNVEVHAKPPRQDIVWQWNFDQDVPEAAPSGFVAVSTPGADVPDWRVLPDHESTTGGQLVVQGRPCPAPDCAHLLLPERVRATYPDITVQIQDLSVQGGGDAGIALAMRDNRNFYAVTLNSSTGMVTTRRVKDGQVTILGQTVAKLVSRPWHTLRVQRINFLHLDRGRLGVFVDGAQVAAVADAVLPDEAQVGLVTFGQTAAKFDGLHVLDLVSNRPLSSPAAY
jgi:hypothetical protein